MWVRRTGPDQPGIAHHRASAKATPADSRSMRRQRQSNRKASSLYRCTTPATNDKVMIVTARVCSTMNCLRSTLSVVEPAVCCALVIMPQLKSRTRRIGWHHVRDRRRPKAANDLNLRKADKVNGAFLIGQQRRATKHQRQNWAAHVHLTRKR